MIKIRCTEEVTEPCRVEKYGLCFSCAVSVDREEKILQRRNVNGESRRNVQKRIRIDAVSGGRITSEIIGDCIREWTGLEKLESTQKMDGESEHLRGISPRFPLRRQDIR